MTNDLHDKPGAWSAERKLLLKEARQRRLIQAGLLLLLVALAVVFALLMPCPGGLGQYR